MIRRSLSVWLMVLVVFATLHAQSQPTVSNPALAKSSTKARPRIGLVLSGGGARGWAHVGVLRWLEEHRIPVDYVAGTSMGGLVGAMYAMGSSPNEIREIGNALDWDKALSGPPSFAELSYRRKEDQRAYPSDIELGAGKDGISLPPGINPGHNIGLIFDRLTLPYASLRNFDDLPIPFRCVATDMLEAKPVVFKSGPLTQALRATMSIPGVFTPLEIDNRILADGGLLNNIPTDVAREMGADIVIAVNVGTPLGTREEILSLPGMLSQIIGVATIESDRRHLQLANLVITPNLGKYTLLDFKAVNAISELGYEAAKQNGAALEKYAVDESTWQSYLAARDARRRTTIPTPTALNVGGTKEQNERSISQTLDPDLGQPIDPEKLGTQLSEIRGEGRYSSLDYTVEKNLEQNRLQIHVREKGYGPALVLPIVQYRSSNISDVKFSLGGRFTIFDVGTYGSELRVDALVGSDDLLGVEYYRPLGRKGFFIAPRAAFASTSVDLFANGDRMAEYRQHRVAAGLDAGYIFNRRTQLRFGHEVGYDSAKVSVGDPLLPTLKGLVGVTRTQFVYEGHDSAMVPTRGASVNAEGRWFFKAPGATTGFPQAEIRGSWLKALDNQGSIFSYGAGGTTFSHSASTLEQFTLGGPFRLGAFGQQEFRGDHFVLLSGGYLRRVGYLPEFLGRKIYGAGWYEVGSAFFDSPSAVYRSSVSGALIMETRLGPLTVGGAVGSGGRGKIFISMGRLF
jgi:NTE family protein